LKKKVLVLGSTGLIGHQIFTYLNSKDNFELFNLSKSELNNETIVLDALNYGEVEKIIFEICPNIVVNCIGILIDESDLNPEKAQELNSKLPHKLLSTCEKINSKLIHISTDCVFLGNKGYYSENDIKDAESTYGRTKAAGEIKSRDHLTLRTSVIGPSLKNTGGELFDWFMSQKHKIEGYTKSIWSGVSTFQLARMIEFSIENNLNEIYNFSNHKEISKYDLLCIINKTFGKNIIIKKVNGIKTNKVLIDNRNLITFQIPEYSKMLKEMYVQMKINSTMYLEYKRYFNH